MLKINILGLVDSELDMVAIPVDETYTGYSLVSQVGNFKTKYPSCSSYFVQGP